MKALLLGWFLFTPCAVDSVAPIASAMALPKDVSAAFESWDGLLTLPAQPECACIVYPACAPGNCPPTMDCVIVGILPPGGCNPPAFDLACACM
jgi:hypothetical protein